MCFQIKTIFVFQLHAPQINGQFGVLGLLVQSLVAMELELETGTALLQDNHWLILEIVMGIIRKPPFAMA